MEKLIIKATPEDEGLRLDKFIADNSGLSRSYASKLCGYGFVLVNGKATEKKYKITGDEEIEVSVPEPDTPTAGPEEIPLNIVYEDDDVIIINKPQGLCVHPAPGCSVPPSIYTSDAEIAAELFSLLLKVTSFKVIFAVLLQLRAYRFDVEVLKFCIVTLLNLTVPAIYQSAASVKAPEDLLPSIVISENVQFPAQF